MTRAVLLAGLAALIGASACSAPAPPEADRRLQECQAHHMMLETAGAAPAMSPAQRLHWCEVHPAPAGPVQLVPMVKACRLVVSDE